MKVEEFASREFIERVRFNLNEALINIGIKEGFVKDRLLTEFTREVCVSSM
jgi:hypothetical protein